MGIKHLFGFFLAIAGFGVGVLFLLFMLQSQAYNQFFLTIMGISAFISLLAGIIILNNSH